MGGSFSISSRGLTERLVNILELDGIVTKHSRCHTEAPPASEVAPQRTDVPAVAEMLPRTQGHCVCAFCSDEEPHQGAWDS